MGSYAIIFLPHNFKLFRHFSITWLVQWRYLLEALNSNFSVDCRTKEFLCIYIYFHGWFFLTFLQRISSWSCDCCWKMSSRSSATTVRFLIKVHAYPMKVPSWTIATKHFMDAEQKPFCSKCSIKTRMQNKNHFLQNIQSKQGFACSGSGPWTNPDVRVGSNSIFHLCDTLKHSIFDGWHITFTHTLSTWFKVL